jgi:uncharacterized protein (DUF58 family)
MPELPRFLDPQILSRISPMDLRAQVVVEGFISGLHKSPYRGFSVEFAEYRQYTPGDDIRDIDWKAYARSDRYYIKQFEDETNLQCFILLDRSASMGYGSGGLTKLEYGSYLAASLAYFINHQRDGVGLITFDQKIQNFLPARSKSSHIYAILSVLDQITAGEATDMGKPLHELADSIRRRGLVILISDLIDETSQTMDALQHFRFKGHDVIVFHIVDPDEINFPFTDTAKFEDPETGEQMMVVPTVIRDEYIQAMEQFMEDNRAGCAKNQVDYLRMETSQPLDFALFYYLSKRSHSY